MRDAGIDIEVNSGGELYKALRIGFRPEQIIFNGTSKTDAELDEAVEAGIYSINVDSIYEIELVEKAAQRIGKRANIALRLTPEIGTRSHLGLQTALLTSKFGISYSEVIEAFRRGLLHPDLINVCGIHIHVGSQTPDIEPFAEAFKTMWEHLVTLHRETGHTLEHINLGGGIPVNYLRDRSMADQLPEHERDMLGADLEPSEVLAGALKVARESARAADAEHLLDRVTILLEPGRSIIADAGLVLTTVRNIKRRPETNDVWLLTDAGYNLLLSMNNYKWYYHLISASRAAATTEADYKVAGPLCDSGDVYFDIEREGRLPDYRSLPARRRARRSPRPAQQRRLLARADVSLQRSPAARRRAGARRRPGRFDSSPRYVRRFSDERCLVIEFRVSSSGFWVKTSLKSCKLGYYKGCGYFPKF